MGHHQNILSKLFSPDDLKAQRETWASNGEQVVFTNGCFDILHRGHVEYLAKAADAGTKLILGLNTDASVKRQNKGPDRPINEETARAIVLAGLQCIDAIVFFDDDTPKALIESLKPDVLVKGGDYDASVTDPSDKRYIVGSDTVLSAGGQVVTIPLVEGFSTTSVIKKMRG